MNRNTSKSTMAKNGFKKWRGKGFSEMERFLI